MNRPDVLPEVGSVLAVTLPERGTFTSTVTAVDERGVQIGDLVPFAWAEIAEIERLPAMPPPRVDRWHAPVAQYRHASTCGQGICGYCDHLIDAAEYDRDHPFYL